MVYHVLCGLEEERMIVFDVELVSLVALAAPYDSLEESWTTFFFFVWKGILIYCDVFCDC